jgi:AraC-like DNA-binding protein
MTRSMTAASRGRFQEAAAPLPQGAQLYAWGARVLYVGPALNLTAHRNAVAVLALALDGSFEVAKAPGDPASAWRPTRTLLIPPDALHHLRSNGGRMAFLYVDPLSRDLERLCDGIDTTALTALIRSLADGARDWVAVRRELTLRLGADAAGPDPRVGAALDALHADPSARLSLDALAVQAGLSASRFRRLFRAATGVTLRRYRLWIAMGAATRAIAAGESLTAAALDAGFSSSAHFSAAFREMFGLEPSRLARGRLTLGADPSPPK